LFFSFLREVAKESPYNNMDASNLATVFAPTIFRSSMEDPIKAVMELKVSHTLLLQIILRENITRSALRLFREIYRRDHDGLDRNITENPVLNYHPGPSSQEMANRLSLDLESMKGLDETQKNEIVDITSGISPAMINRIFRGRGENNRNSAAVRKIMDDVDEDPSEIRKAAELGDDDDDDDDEDERNQREAEEQKHISDERELRKKTSFTPKFKLSLNRMDLKDSEKTTDSFNSNNSNNYSDTEANNDDDDDDFRDAFSSPDPNREK
jgi:hypothetical protein